MIPHFPRYLWNRSHNPRPLGCQLRIAWNNIMKREGWRAAGEILYGYAGILSFPAIITNNLPENQDESLITLLQAYSLSFFLSSVSARLSLPLATAYAIWFLLGEAAGTWDPVTTPHLHEVLLEHTTLRLSLGQSRAAEIQWATHCARKFYLLMRTNGGWERSASEDSLGETGSSVG